MLPGMARRRGDPQFERASGGRALGGRDRSLRARVRRRRLIAALAVPLTAALVWLLASSGGGSPTGAKTSKGTLTTAGATTAPSHSAPVSAATRPRTARLAVAPRLLVSPTPASAPTWTVVAQVRGRPAAWLKQAGGVTLMRFDQGHVHLTLHAGSLDGGAGPWTYGDQITAREIHQVVAAFNGGFRLTYANVGFVSGGRVAVALKRGLASIVTYTDGTTGIGAWQEGVPTATRHVFSVLQNQSLLVDRGVAAPNVSSCVLACWGATIKSVTVVARSGIGITAGGQLVWAAGEQLTPAQLASALIGAGAIRAVELDINPDWVAGYLYVHHPSGPVASPVVPGQLGIAGQLLAPYTRDFLAVVAN